MKLRLDEVRRLTGPNLLWHHSGAIVDVFVDAGDAQVVAECWQNWVHKLMAEFGWGDEHSTYRLHAEGANLAISAPLDALYVACDLAELAWDCCAAELQLQPCPDWQPKLAALRSELAAEQNPALLSIVAAAQKHQVTVLSDDDELSLGMGATSQLWAMNRLPESSQLQWSDYRDIPVAYVTGTNGKSTSVRLAAQIAKCAGLQAGVTSTDFIKVGEEVIDYGDYSGPGGARTLLRDPRTEIAFLEVARGGILRRGLPVAKVDAALVTNVASDHLGQYGINSVAELAQAKFVVAKALDSSAVLVVNADNEQTRQQALQCDNTLCWFSTAKSNQLIQQQLKEGGRAVFVEAGRFKYGQKGKTTDICALTDAPMTMGGSAQHNVQNALGVIGLSIAMGISVAAIVAGLKSFGSNAEDNPGRGNIYQLENSKVIVDFAHNEHSMRAVVEMVKRMPAKRRLVMFGHAGDRSDADIRDLTMAVRGLEADIYLIAELEDYLRGRELGELPQLMTQVLVDSGVDKSQIQVVDNPVVGTQTAVELARDDDVLLLFVLAQRDAVHQWLSQRVAT